MSDLIAAVRIKNQFIYLVDFDRPVWINRENDKLRIVPDLNHFLVDAILGCLPSEKLKDFDITDVEINGELNNDPISVERNRRTIYRLDNLEFEIIYSDLELDLTLKLDLANFYSQPILTKVSLAELEKLCQPKHS